MYEKKRKKRRDGKAGKRSTETETVSLKENSGEKSPGAVDPHPGLFLPEHLGGLKKGQQPHPQLLLLPHPQPLLFHPPQQERRSRIQIILQPLFPNRLLLETPHPLSQPQPLSHPHPQFVAAKSLMFVPPKESFCLQFMI